MPIGYIILYKIKNNMFEHIKEQEPNQEPEAEWSIRGILVLVAIGFFIWYMVDKNNTKEELMSATYTIEISYK